MRGFMRFRFRPQTLEERRNAARLAVRRAIWYFVLLVILLILISKPEFIIRFIR
jgi:hypothetical protein